MVINAITGFTMQNWSVAWEGEGKGVRLGRAGLGWSQGHRGGVGQGPLTCLQKRKNVME